ncbi:MAG: AbrB/MazE/SpoVT family DNA-binding domain-containing protein [Bacteroidetes bacterium]|jgi:antitoxin MazE|nr:AbrB/MazE/SpoVT family DNA-binding domain-containing protein [Bacteroidota bacterium]
MKATVIKVGNSKGIILSKTVLEHYQITDEIEMLMQKDQIVLRPIKKTRVGWDKAFKEMAEQGDDSLLISDVFDDETFDTWS